jgi:uncharacterized protein (TIGR02757 family)
MDLREMLERRVKKYKRSEFVLTDPICVPHGFVRREDVEISALFTATLAWGKREQIIKSARKLMRLMDDAPHDFVLNAQERDYRVFDGFVHRTFNAVDAASFCRALKEVYLAGGPEDLFAADDLMDGAARFYRTVAPMLAPRSRKHIPDVAKGSAAKRLFMFLRWMVRCDEVDFGLWKKISPAQLYVPLDVHTGNVARADGLLTRKINDRKAVEELTRKLREFCPHDPVKYDFALFAAGVNSEHGFDG